MKTSATILILLLLHGSICAQKKIYIRSGAAHHPYIFLNSEDSSFMKLGYSEDMGVRSYHYQMKDSLPDGRYALYVDGKLRIERSFKNRLPDSLWITYADDSRTIFPYKKGMATGYMKEIRNDGSLAAVAKLAPNGAMYIRTQFHKNGNISTREFLIPGEGHCRVEFFDEDGGLSGVETQPMRQSAVQHYKQGKLNGEAKYFYTKGTFTITYKDNKIVRWKYVNFADQTEFGED